MSVKYLLPCSCGQVTPVEAGQAGQRVTCVCGQTLTAPTMRGMAALDKISEPDPKPKRERRWSRAQGMFFSGGVIVALLALMTAGYFGVVYSEVESNKAHIRDHYEGYEDDHRIDELSASELFEEWKAYQAAGLDEVDSAQWRQLSYVGSHLSVAIGSALAVALAGILTAVGALFIRPKAT